MRSHVKFCLSWTATQSVIPFAFNRQVLICIKLTFNFYKLDPLNCNCVLENGHMTYIQGAMYCLLDKLRT